MDSLTDDRNSWFNAVRLEDSHDYSSATLSYIEDASRCLSRSSFIRSAMSASCAGSCLAKLGDVNDALKFYSAAANLYEHNAELSAAKSLRESLWSLLHAFEYFTLVSDHVSAERVSKKYADLSRRIDRFEAQSAFDALKIRREKVLAERATLGSPGNESTEKSIRDWGVIQRTVKAFLQQVQGISLPSRELDDFEGAPPQLPAEEVESEEGLEYETEPEYLERRIVS